MTSKTLVLALIVGVSLTATGCAKIKKLMGGKPSGQVVATLDGQEITSLELNQELSGFASRDPKLIKAAQQQALQQIIMRNILAKQAEAQKMDKTPQYSLRVRQISRTLLAQMYESKLASGILPPTHAEAEAYIAKHPDQYAQRRLFILEQVISPAAGIPRAELEGQKSLEEVKSMLDRLSIPYQENAAAIDTLTANPDSVNEISKMPAGEVFIIPQGGRALMFNRVSQVRSVPFKGELAINYAMEALRKVQLDDLVRTKIVGLRIAAEPRIVYAPGFKPPSGPGARPPAGAAPAPAPK